MCNPAASLATQATGAALSAVGAYSGAKAQQAALQSQARIAEINATLVDAQARNELYASERQQNQLYLRGAEVKASQTSAYAGRGIDVGVGTPVNVATSTDYITKVDANQAAANGIQAAWGRRIEANNLRREAVSERATAQGIAPGMAAFTSLVSSAGQVAQSWYSMSKSGALGGSGGQNASLTASAERGAMAGLSSLSRLPDGRNGTSFGVNYDNILVRW